MVQAAAGLELLAEGREGPAELEQVLGNELAAGLDTRANPLLAQGDTLLQVRPPERRGRGER